MSLIHNVNVEHQIIKVSTLNSYSGELPFAKAIWLRADFWSNSGLDSLLTH
jgi:hypothetical protein